MNQNWLTLKRAAKLIPAGDSGTVSVKSLQRWCLMGCRGIVLRSVVIGGRRYTSQDWLDEFTDGCTMRANRIANPPASKGHAGALEVLRKLNGKSSEEKAAARACSVVRAPVLPRKRATRELHEVLHGVASDDLVRRENDAGSGGAGVSAALAAGAVACATDEQHAQKSRVSIGVT